VLRRNGIRVDIDPSKIPRRNLPSHIHGATWKTDRKNRIGRSQSGIRRFQIFEASGFRAFAACSAAIFRGPHNAHATLNEAFSDCRAHFTGM
jgi:hypothetical protein